MIGIDWRESTDFRRYWTPRVPKNKIVHTSRFRNKIVHTSRFSENGFRPHRLAGQSWRPLNKASWSRFAASSRWDRSRTPKPRKSDFSTDFLIFQIFRIFPIGALLEPYWSLMWTEIQQKVFLSNCELTILGAG